MRTPALALACLICASHARRVQPSSERVADGADGEDGPSGRLARLLLASTVPSAGWQPAGPVLTRALNNPRHTLHHGKARFATGVRLCAPTVTSEEPKADAATAAETDTDTLPAPPRMKVKQIVESEDDLVGRKVTLQGWVRTIRDQKKFAFIQINDGSSQTNFQAVAEDHIDTYDQVSKLATGAAVEVVGTIVESQGKGQKYEVQAEKVKVVGECPPEYPLQKKRQTQEFMRTLAHLRPRTNLIAAAARVRSALAYATHKHFQDQGFIYLQSPLITASDCEGAGEMFRVTTLPLDNLQKIPREKNGTGANFKKDFFSKPAYLTVSGQLSGETYACALGDIYTFGPTFRAENSQTTRHLAEFHMIEPEMAFCDMFGAIDQAEAYVKACVAHVLKNCDEDLQFFQKFLDKGLIERLTALVEKPFVRLPYKDAISLLQEEIAKDPSKWQFPEVEFGTDLATEHERWLAEKKFGSCVFVHNYPRKIKAFYMRDGDGEDKDTCESFDLLVPGVGELIGGSAREERLDVLSAKLKEFGLIEEDYWWYMDLRRFGSVPHAGFGLGFERLVCYTTGIENIREAIAYPRYPGSAEF
mmetsp:Transcript_68700/g.129644  ORF Transcript_68700/g.129644 Transcript_68700/m.129644 type:complete len:588 (-) Transcript_68700:50-1813(-)